MGLQSFSPREGQVVPYYVCVAPLHQECSLGSLLLNCILDTPLQGTQQKVQVDLHPDHLLPQVNSRENMQHHHHLRILFEIASGHYVHVLH